MKKIALPFILLTLGMLVVTCKKSSDNNPPRIITIQGFKLTDFNGNAIGQVGDADSDWTFMSSLSDKEMKLFEFGDTVSLDNTSPATVTMAAPYPNPVAAQQMYYFSSPYPVVAKLVVVDDRLGIILQRAIRISGSQTYSFDFSNRLFFKNRSSLRVYYSFSATGSPNYLVGYGDIRICDGTTTADCF